jgi:hypothetical protein
MRIWYDIDETIPEPARRPHTFMLVSRGFGTRESVSLVTDAVRRLVRGENAENVRATLTQQQGKEPTVTLAKNVSELEQHLFENFRLGDNSVEGGPSEHRSGKHIGQCYTYHSTDHNLF